MYGQAKCGVPVKHPSVQGWMQLGSRHSRAHELLQTALITRAGKHASLRTEQQAHSRMVVALVDCRVGAEEVEVAAPVDVPHVHALAFVQHHRHRRIVVRAVPLLTVDVLRHRAWMLSAIAHAKIHHMQCLRNQQHAGRCSLDATPTAALVEQGAVHLVQVRELRGPLWYNDSRAGSAGDSMPRRVGV